MANCTWMGRTAATALLSAGLLGVPVGLDVQGVVSLTRSDACAEGLGRGDGPGGRSDAAGGASDAARGDGPGGQSGAGESAAARGDASDGRSGPGGSSLADSRARETSGDVGPAPVDEGALATARERYTRALGPTSQVSVEATAVPGQGLVKESVAVSFETVEPVLFFDDEATDALIERGWEPFPAEVSRP